jgi:hypothetical protein
VMTMRRWTKRFSSCTRLHLSGKRIDGLLTSNISASILQDTLGVYMLGVSSQQAACNDTQQARPTNEHFAPSLHAPLTHVHASPVHAHVCFLPLVHHGRIPHDTHKLHRLLCASCCMPIDAVSRCASRMLSPRPQQKASCAVCLLWRCSGYGISMGEVLIADDFSQQALIDFLGG